MRVVIDDVANYNDDKDNYDINDDDNYNEAILRMIGTTATQDIQNRQGRFTGAIVRLKPPIP